MIDLNKEAEELVEKYLKLPINYPYVDTEDGVCIGSGKMTHSSAVKCAEIAVKAQIEVLKEHRNPETMYWLDKSIDNLEQQLKQLENG